MTCVRCVCVCVWCVSETTNTNVLLQNPFIAYASPQIRQSRCQDAFLPCVPESCGFRELVHRNVLHTEKLHSNIHVPTRGRSPHSIQVILLPWKNVCGYNLNFNLARSWHSSRVSAWFLTSPKRVIFPAQPSRLHAINGCVVGISPGSNCTRFRARRRIFVDFFVRCFCLGCC